MHNESFTNKFENLVKMGLYSTWDKKGKVLSYENYRKSLFIFRGKEDKFQGMVDTLRGQTIVYILIDDFHVLWKIQNLFSNPQSWISHSCR
jgi:hypothetical protein